MQLYGLVKASHLTYFLTRVYRPPANPSLGMTTMKILKVPFYGMQFCLSKCLAIGHYIHICEKLLDWIGDIKGTTINCPRAEHCNESLKS